MPSKNLDLAWVASLRKDFLTLVGNLPRVKDYDTALQLNAALRTYRKRFNELFFDNFMNRSLEDAIGISESDSSWLNKTLRETAWSFSIELINMPIERSDDYYSEAARFAHFEKEGPKWKARIQRKASVFWKAMKEFIEWYEARHKKPVTIYEPKDESVVMEGLTVVMRGFRDNYDYHEEILHRFREGLKLYKARAVAVAPILIKKAIPIVLDFKATLDKGGEWDNDHLIVYGSSLLSKSPKWAAHIMAHEMGHHIFRTYLSGEAKTFWEQTIYGDFGTIDIQELLDKWPGDAWAFEFPELLGSTDPVLALQIVALSNDRAFTKLEKKEDFEALLRNGQRTIRVPQTPITGYANKNPEEAFCETVGLLVAYGPRAVHEKVRYWLETTMPGYVKVSNMSTEFRVASRFVLALGMGETKDVGTVRIHRYRDQYKFWDLTNAGKRGKTVEVLSVAPAFMGTKADDWMDRMDKAIAPYDDFDSIYRFFADVSADYPNEVRMYSSKERGIDVLPGGTRKIRFETRGGIRVEATPHDFLVVNHQLIKNPKEDGIGDFYQDTMYYPASKKDAAKFYGWLAANEDAAKKFDMNWLRKLWRELDVKYDSH